MTLNVRTDRWTPWHAAAAAALVALGVWATLDAWKDIYQIATTDDEYSHIFLVPLVAVWLVWVRRMRIRHARISGTLLGPMIVAAGWLIGTYGYSNNHQSLWHGGAVTVVVGCAIAVLGKQALFRFFPAVAVLVFLIPVPGMIRQSIALPLMSWTAEVSYQLLSGLGVDALRIGNTLQINGNPVAIAEACNGVRGIFALVLVSYAFSFGLPLRNSVRWLILLASPLATIFCNVVRIIPTAWLYGQPESIDFAHSFHDIAGWLMLPMAGLLLYGIIKLLRWAMIPVNRYTLAS